MHETFTNVVGVDDLMNRLRDCWASVYGQRVIVPQGPADDRGAHDRRRRPEDGELGTAGVMFDGRSSTSDSSTIVLEAAFGLGEVVVGAGRSGYLRHRQGRSSRVAHVGHKEFKVVRDDQGASAACTSRRRRPTAEVSDYEAELLAMLALRVEDHYGSPQDIEWAEEDGTFYLVQTRPITTLAKRHRRRRAARHRARRVTGRRLGSGPRARHAGRGRRARGG
ncbi:MAG: PEP/pyruvate-binding domain-containing protein [Vicinamibacterales bacterium]